MHHRDPLPEPRHRRFRRSQGNLPHWLLNRIDRGFRLRFALQSPAVAGPYDCVLIDTQGAVGPLQDAAVLAADILVSPITPEILSAREFRTDDGTARSAGTGQRAGATLGPMKAVIYRQDRTADARVIAWRNSRRFHQAQRTRIRFSTPSFLTPKPTKEAATCVCRCTAASADAMVSPQCMHRDASARLGTDTQSGGVYADSVRAQERIA